MNRSSEPSHSDLESLLGQVAGEFADRCNRGEVPDVEEVAKQYPEIADVLREILPALQVLNKATPHLEVQSNKGNLASTPLKTTDPIPVHRQSNDTGQPDLNETTNHVLRDGRGLHSTFPDSAEAGDASLRIAGYEILGTLGRGGMGIVYKARQIGLNRLVALKMIRSAELADAEERERFQREALAVAQLQHPNVVQIYEVGEHQGCPYFSLELVEGGNLDRHLNREPQSPRTAAEQVEVLARAVHVAHEHGLIHRDLKPANVLIAEDGTLKVTDFGLVKKVGDESGQTQTGAIVGTPSYMAPEQAGASGDVGPAADLYALGTILYEMLTGRPPFKGTSLLQTLEQVRHQEPVPPRQLQPSIPKDLETICLKCLNKEPGKRYDTALSLANDLRAFLENRPIQARPISLRERTVKWMRRDPALATLAGVICASVVLLSIALLVAVSYYRRADFEFRRAEREKEDAREARAAEARKAKEAQRARDDEAKEARKARIAEAKKAVEAESNRRGQTAAHLREVAHLVVSDPMEAQKMLNNPKLFPLDLRGPEWRYLFGQSQRLHAQLPGAMLGRFATVGTSMTLLTHEGRLQRIESDQVTRDVPGPRRNDIREVGFGLGPRPRISPDGRHLAFLDTKMNVQIWDVDKGEKWKTLAPEKTRSTTALAWTPDSRSLFLGFNHGSADLRNVATGKVIASFTSRTRESINKAVFSSDGKTLVIATVGPGQRGSVCLWDVNPFQEKKVLYRHSKQVTALAVHPTGQVIVSGSWKGSVVIYQNAQPTPTVLKQTLESEVASLSFSRNGRYLAVAGGADLNRIEVFVRDLRTMQVVFKVERPGPTFREVRFSPDNALLACVGLHRTTLWKLKREPSRLVFQRPQGRLGQPNVISPDGKLIVVARGGGSCVLVQSRSGKVIPIQGAGLSSDNALFTPDGQSILGIDRRSGLRCWSTRTGTLRWNLRDPRIPPRGWLTLSPDSKILVGVKPVSSPNNRLACELQTWDLATGKSRGAPIRLSMSIPYPVTFSPDSRKMFVATRPAPTSPFQIRCWDLTQGPTPGRELPAFGEIAIPVSGLHVSPDGNLLAVQTHSQVEIFDLRQNRKRFVAPANTSASPVFSPDSKRLATVSRSHPEIHFWDVETGERRAILSGHEGRIEKLIYPADGKSFVSRSSDGTTRFWDPQTGQERMKWRTGTRMTQTLHFTPEQELMITQDNAGVRGWAIPYPAEEAVLLKGRKIETLQIDGTGNSLTAVDNETVWTFNLKTGKAPTMPFSHGVAPVVEGETIALVTQNHEIRILDRLTGEERARLKSADGKQIQSLAISPDERTVVSASYLDGWIRIWDVAKAQERARVSLKPSAREQLAPQTMTISLDSKVVAVRAYVNHAGRPEPSDVRLFRLRDGNEEKRFDLFAMPQEGDPGQSKVRLVFGPQEKKIVAWNPRSVNVIDRITGQVWSLNRKKGEVVRSVAFHPGGEHLAFCVDDYSSLPQPATGAVCLWDLSREQGIRSLPDVRSQTWSVAFSADGETMAVGGDEEITLWDGHGRKKLDVIAHPGDGVLGFVPTLAFSGDGRKLASALFAKDVRVWNLAKLPSRTSAEGPNRP